MDAYMILEATRKLLGPVNPVGLTHEDERRFENLRALRGVVNGLINDLQEVSDDNLSSPEASRKKAGEYAEECLAELEGRA